MARLPVCACQMYGIYNYKLSPGVLSSFQVIAAEFWVKSLPLLLQTSNRLLTAQPIAAQQVMFSMQA